LLLASKSFHSAKEAGRLVFRSNNFVEWAEEHCTINKTKEYDYISFVEWFANFSKVLKCQLTFEWFRTNGKRVSTYLQAKRQAAAAFQSSQNLATAAAAVTADINHFPG